MSILSFHSSLLIDTPLPGIVLSSQIYLFYMLLSRSHLSEYPMCRSSLQSCPPLQGSLTASLQISKQTFSERSLDHIGPLPFGENQKKTLLPPSGHGFARSVGLVGGSECLLGWAPLFSEQLSQPNVVALVPQASMIPSLYFCNNMTLNGYANHLYRTPTQSLIGEKFRGGKVQPSAWVCLISLALEHMSLLSLPLQPKEEFLH